MRRILALLAILTVVCAPILVAQDAEVPPYAGHLAELIALVSTFVGSVVLGVLKRYTTMLDKLWGGLIKPIQPLVAAAFGMFVPTLAQWLHVDLGDPNEFVLALASATVVVVIRELKEFALEKLGYKEKDPAPSVPL